MVKLKMKLTILMKTEFFRCTSLCKYCITGAECDLTAHDGTSTLGVKMKPDEFTLLTDHVREEP
jgi:hypothetical protein